jgi:hypothetical protein
VEWTTSVPLWVRVSTFMVCGLWLAWLAASKFQHELIAPLFYMLLAALFLSLAIISLLLRPVADHRRACHSNRPVLLPRVFTGCRGAIGDVGQVVHRVKSLSF